MVKVMCFGSFDIVHEGHKFYLREAKKLGDELVVVVARDETITAVKKRSPHYNEQQRVEHVKDLKIADKVILGNPGDKLQVVLDEKPDILAFGYDQTHFTKGILEKLTQRHIHGVKVIRLPAFHPDKYKSSKMKADLEGKHE